MGSKQLSRFDVICNDFIIKSNFYLQVKASVRFLKGKDFTTIHKLWKLCFPIWSIDNTLQLSSGLKYFIGDTRYFKMLVF